MELFTALVKGILAIDVCSVLISMNINYIIFSLEIKGFVSHSERWSHIKNRTLQSYVRNNGSSAIIKFDHTFEPADTYLSNSIMVLRHLITFL